MADRTVAVRLTADTTAYNSALQRASAQTSALDRHTRSIGPGAAGSFDRATAAAKGLASGIGSIAYAASRTASLVGALGLGAALAQGLSTASFEEQAQQSFTTLLKNGQQAKDFMGQLAQFAADTPFELNGLVDTTRQLLGVGVAAKDVIPTLTAWGDASGALGLSQDQFNRAMLAVTQSMAKGKVQSEEMMQLTEAGIPAWNLLSEATGKNVPELQKLAQQGDLLASDVFPKLQAQLEKDYGGSMAKQAQTLAGVWSTVKDNLKLAEADAVRPLAESLKVVLPDASAAAADAIRTLGVRASTGLADLIKHVQDLAPLGHQLRETYGPEFAKLGEVAAQKWHQFTELLIQLGHEVAPSLPSLIDSLVQIAQTGGEVSKDLFPLLQSGLKLAGPLAEGLASTLRLVANALDAIEPVLPVVVAGFLAFKGVSAANAALQSLRGSLGGVSQTLAEMSQKAAFASYGMNGLAGNAAGKVSTGLSGTQRAVQGLSAALPVVGFAIAGVSTALAANQEAFDQTRTSAEGFYKQLDQGGVAADHAQAKLDLLRKQADHQNNFLGLGTDFKAAMDQAAAGAKAAQDEMSSLQQAQQKVSEAQNNLNKVSQTYSQDSPQYQAAVGVYRGAVDNLKLAQDQADRATRSHTEAMALQAQQALGAASADLGLRQAQLGVAQAQQNYTQVLKDHLPSSQEAMAAEQGLESAYFAAAQAAAAKAVADNQGKSQTEIATLSAQAQLKTLQDLAQQMGGNVPDSVKQLIASLQATASQSAQTGAQVSDLGLTIIGLPNEHYTDIKAPTGEQMTALERLGVKIETLPDGNVRVYADLTGAQKAMDDWISQHRQVTVGLSVSTTGSLGWRGQQADGGVLPGWTPGRDVHRFFSPTIGTLDLSGGEAVMRPEFTAAVGAGWIHGANRAARSGGIGGVRSFLGLADGGLVNALPFGTPAALPWNKTVPVSLDTSTAAGAWAAFANSMASSISSGAGGSARWAGVVLQALAMLGQPGSLLATVLRRMNQESGGNPSAINLWDVNAQRGDPSRGLMQVIGSTFRAYAMPGYASNIYDPLSNVLASMRYAISRYGSLSAAYNRAGGYENGTPYVPVTGMAKLHQGERVVTARDNSTLKVLSREIPFFRSLLSGASGGSSASYTGMVINGDAYMVDPAEPARQSRRGMSRALAAAGIR